MVFSFEYYWKENASNHRILCLFLRYERAGHIIYVYNSRVVIMERINRYVCLLLCFFTNFR